jgi:lipopolysaccharide/colanic/teichoic acid biosynthesis glycosyltransferase
MSSSTEEHTRGTEVSQPWRAARRMPGGKRFFDRPSAPRSVEVSDKDLESVAGSPSDRGTLLRRWLIAADAGAITAASALALLLPIPGELGLGLAAQAGVIAVCLPAFFVVAHLSGLYHLVDRHLDHTLAEELGPVFMTVTVWSFLVLVGTAAAASEPLATGWFVEFWAIALLLVLAARVAVRHSTQRSAWYRQRVLVVGDPGGIDRVLRRIRRHPECGLDVVGSVYRAGRGLRAFKFDQRGDRHDLGHRPTDTPSDVLSLVTDARVERVVVTGWAEALDERTELIRLLTAAGVYVDIVSGEPETLLVGAAMHHLEGLPIMTVRPGGPTRLGRILKRLLDVAVSSIGLLILSPLLAYISFRIKVDSPGPVLFRQRRVGLDGNEFEIVKFRTMVHDAEDLKDGLRDGSQIGSLFKLREDPRITSFGAKIRKNSLDELPQLWNVLKGPWQIHGRSDIPFEDMVKLDYTYVSTWSLQEDLRLLIRTVGVVFAGRGAY